MAQPVQQMDLSVRPLQDGDIIEWFCDFLQHDLIVRYGVVCGANETPLLAIQSLFTFTFLVIRIGK